MDFTKGMHTDAVVIYELRELGVDERMIAAAQVRGDLRGLYNRFITATEGN